MKRNKKIFLWIGGVTGIIIALLLVLDFLIPRIINIESVKNTIQSRASHAIGGAVEFQRMDLSILPLPHVEIHQASLSIPETARGTLESLRAYPKILPLLTGNIDLSKLQIDRPDFTVQLPEKPVKKKDKPEGFSPEAIKRQIALVLAPLALNMPDLTVAVENGRLDVVEKNEQLFSFHDIQGSVVFPPHGPRIYITCSSNLWESVVLKGRLDLKDFKGEGKIELEGFNLLLLTESLFPDATKGIGESIVNMTASVHTEGLTVLDGVIKGSSPLLTLTRAQKRLVIKAKNVEASFHMDADKTTVSLAELDLEYPQLSVSGEFLMDRTIPRVSLELRGKEVNVYSTREAALALAGDIDVIQEISEIVKGGSVSLLTFSSQGGALADLGILNNMVMKGRVEEGDILVPKIDLHLEDARGDLLISKGILEGRNLEARSGNSTGTGGIVKLGLSGEDAPFHIETEIESDLSQLPSILEKVVDNEAFLKELSLLNNVTGRAVGRLTLGESMESIKTRVEVSELLLSADYRQIPYPLEIERGQFSYEETGITVKDLKGSVGKSSFSGLSARLGFGKTSYLEVLSGESVIALGEMYSWLASSEGLDDVLGKIESLQGTVTLSSLNLKGPLSNPEKWQFKFAGHVKDLAMSSPLLPGSVAVRSGDFSAVPEKLSFADVEAGVLDASLRVSGNIIGYLEGLQKSDITINGTIGEQAIKWIKDSFPVPPEIRLIGPLYFSETYVAWDKHGGASFRGEVSVHDGPDISLDVLRTPDELTINKLRVKDKKSEALLTFRLKERELALTFAGNLHKNTFDQLTIQQYGNGWIQGNMKMHILMDQPVRSTVQGKLEGGDITVPWGQKVPIEIKNFSLRATGSALHAHSITLVWGDHQFLLQGNVERSEQGFITDIDLSADGIELEKIRNMLDSESEEEKGEKAEKEWSLPLQGIVRFKSDYVNYGDFSLRPLHADIYLNPESIQISILDASLCGITAHGNVTISPQDVQLDIQPLSRDQELEPALTCLFGKSVNMTGKYELSGKVMARGRADELLSSLNGNVEFIARDGRIYRYHLLAKILALVNVTEIFRGKFPAIGKEGFVYDSIIIRGKLQNGKLLLTEAVMDGDTMEIVGKGDINLADKKVNVTLLVAPLKTVDAVIKKIPLVRYILAGSLISIPIKVTGVLGATKVKTIPASAVGEGVLGIMKRTFQLPYKIIEPIIPKEKIE